MNDIEKNNVYVKDQAPSPDYSSNTAEPNYEETTEVRQPYSRRIWDSFKRDPNLSVTPKGTVGADGRVFNPDNAALATANSPLARKLKGRHLQMIAIGGSIGEYTLNRSYGWLLTTCRNWSFRCIWQGSQCWWPGISIDLLLPHRYHVILHGARAR
jgi:hypothetical protein